MARKFGFALAALLLASFFSCASEKAPPSLQLTQEPSLTGLIGITEEDFAQSATPPVQSDGSTETATTAPLPKVRVINDIADWDKLGMPDPAMSRDAEYIRSRFELFLSGNNSKFPRGERMDKVYRCYDTLRFGEYTLTLNSELSYYDKEYLILCVEITQSGMELLPPGRYNFKYYSYSDEFLLLEDALTLTDRYKTPAYHSLILYFETLGPDLAADKYGSLQAEFLWLYNIYIIKYASNALHNGDGVTIDELNDFAKRYLNLEKLRDIDLIDTSSTGGKYVMTTYRDAYVSHTYVGEQTQDGATTITVDFFADTAKTVRADRMEYTMVPVGDYYKVASCKVIRESEFSVYVSR